MHFAIEEGAASDGLCYEGFSRSKKTAGGARTLRSSRLVTKISGHGTSVKISAARTALMLAAV